MGTIRHCAPYGAQNTAFTHRGAHRENTMDLWTIADRRWTTWSTYDNGERFCIIHTSDSLGISLHAAPSRNTPNAWKAWVMVGETCEPYPMELRIPIQGAWDEFEKASRAASEWWEENGSGLIPERLYGMSRSLEDLAAFMGEQGCCNSQCGCSHE